MKNIITSWKKDFLLRKKYAVPSREPFFALAGTFLPHNENAVIIDIGAGDGAFASFLELNNRYKGLHLLDQNEGTVKELQKVFRNVHQYTAPEKLPFQNNPADFLHLSHIVEHFDHPDLYRLLSECVRVLRKDGILVISAPLLWDRFYDNLSHIRPYNPSVFTHYLCKGHANATSEFLTTDFEVKNLTYRYRSVQLFEVGAQYFFLDVLLRILRVILTKCGFRKYTKNGFTLILQRIKRGE